MRTEKKRVLIASDLVTSHIDGVRTTYSSIVPVLRDMGHEVIMLYVDEHYSDPPPWGMDLLEPGLVMPNLFHVFRRTDELVRQFMPDAIHIATEGVMGNVMRRYCTKRSWPFTTAYHTQWPLYFKARAGVPERLTWKGLVWFHSAAQTVLATNEDMKRELGVHGITHTKVWSRGVDSATFSPDDPITFSEYPRPHWLNVGRVTPEKGLQNFCSLDLPGTKFIVGDGTARKNLERQFPTTVFLGEEHDRRKLARIIAGMDVFIFPSRSDTFGLVMIEANACGLPVAAYSDAIGPSEYIVNGRNGFKNVDLREAALACLAMGKLASCREEALYWGWEKPAEEFVEALVPIR